MPRGGVRQFSDSGGAPTEPVSSYPAEATGAGLRQAPRDLSWIELVPAGVVVLDDQGTIVAANRNWREFETINGAGIPAHGMGVNYLTICQTSGEHQTARAIKEVLEGTRPRYAAEYTCHSALARHWYRMEAVSNPPDGVLLFHWPINAPGAAQLEEAPKKALPNTCNEVIFLVEDNYQLRILASRTLRQLGYTVLTASSGTEALELAKVELHRVDLLLSDIILGDSLGTELARTFQQQRPSLKLLFVSGYAPQTVSEDLTELSHHFLEKPFTPSDLGKAVRDCLDEAPQK